MVLYEMLINKEIKKKNPENNKVVDNKTVPIQKQYWPNSILLNFSFELIKLVRILVNIRFIITPKANINSF